MSGESGARRVALAHPMTTPAQVSLRPGLATLLLAGLLVAAGCIPSLNPLYTDKDLSFDPALVGAWGDMDDASGSWTFTRSGPQSYGLVIRDKGNTSLMEARLVALGDYRFLDLYPNEDGLAAAKVEDFYRAALVPGHLFLKVLQVEPELRLVLLDEEWLDKLLAADPGAIRHNRAAESGRDHRVVLTASTAELQAFVLKHAGGDEAFPSKNSSHFVRVPSAQR